MLDALPKDLDGYYGMARCYALDGQDKKSLDMLIGSKKLGIEDKVEVQKIRDIINNKKKKVRDGKSSLIQKKKVK